MLQSFSGGSCSSSATAPCATTLSLRMLLCVPLCIRALLDLYLSLCLHSLTPTLTPHPPHLGPSPVFKTRGHNGDAHLCLLDAADPSAGKGCKRTQGQRRYHADNKGGQRADKRSRAVSSHRRPPRATRSTVSLLSCLNGSPRGSRRPGPILGHW